MSADALKKTAETLAEYCRTQQEDKGLSELYDDGAVSVEMSPMPGTDSAESVGVDAIKGKHEWWGANFEVHGGGVEGPYLHGDDKFALIFEIDATEKASGQRWQMKEVAVYTVNDAGKIVREEFMGQPQ